MYVCTYVKVHTYVRTLETAKPVSKEVMAISVDRWSLYEGALLQLKWTIGQPTAVFIDRWSLYASGC